MRSKNGLGAYAKNFEVSLGPHLFIRGLCYIEVVLCLLVLFSIIAMLIRFCFFFNFDEYKHLYDEFLFFYFNVQLYRQSTRFVDLKMTVQIKWPTQLFEKGFL